MKRDVIQIKYGFIRFKQGFSLLETLLTIVVLAAVLLVISGVLNSYTNRVIAQNSADYIRMIDQSIKDILSNPSNFKRLSTALRGLPGDRDEITLEELRDGNIAGVSFGTTARLNDQAYNALPMDKTAAVSIVFRTVALGDDAIEYYILVNKAMDKDIVFKTAEILGPSGGYFVRSPAANSYELRAFYGQWVKSRADVDSEFAGTDWHDLVDDEATRPDRDQAYLVAYSFVNGDIASGAYLYRTSQGDTSYNTLYADLDMGGNNLIGPDNVDISNDMELKGGASVDSFMAESMVSNGANVLVNENVKVGHMNVAGNLSIDSDLVVDNRIDIYDIQSSSAKFEGGIDAKDLEINVLREVDIDFADLEIGELNESNKLVGGELYAESIDVASNRDLEIEATKSVNAETVNVAGSVIVKDDDGTRARDVQAGFLDLTVKDGFESDRMVVDRVYIEKLDVSNGAFGDCEAGC